MLVNLFLTLGCNLQCTYCYVDQPSSTNTMSQQVALDSVRFILDAARQQGSNALGMGFSGGEPLLCWETMQAVVEEVAVRTAKSNLHVNFILTTNGTLLTPEIGRFFSQYDFNVSLSLDGPRVVHDANRLFHNGKGSFDSVKKALPLLRKVRPDAVARLTFTSTTIHALSDSVKFAADCGFDAIKPVPDYFDTRWTADHIQQCEVQFEKILQWLPGYWANGRNIQVGLIEQRLHPRRVGPCRAGLTSEQFSIAPSGDIYPCSYLIGDPAYAIGNVYEGIDMERAQKAHCLDQQPFARQDCERCRLFYVCDSGRCTFLNLQTTGAMGSPSPFLCTFERLMFRIVSKYQALELDKMRRTAQANGVNAANASQTNLTECI